MKSRMTLVVAMIGCLAMFGCGKAKVEVTQGDDPTGQEIVQGSNQSEEQNAALIDEAWEKIIREADRSRMLYPLPEVSTVAEIEAAGRTVTSQDLLNALDYLSFVGAKSTSYTLAEDSMDWYNALSAEFVGIGTNTELIADENGQMVYKAMPFYYLHKENLYGEDGKYVVTVTSNEAWEDTVMDNPLLLQLGVGKAEFEKMMEYLQVNSFEITQEYLEEKGLRGFESLVGTRAYEGITITEELIRGITDDECLRTMTGIAEDWTKTVKQSLRPVVSSPETPSGQENEQKDKQDEQELDELDKAWENVLSDVDQNGMLYPLPEVSTVAEIEAAGRTVTSQDLLNALNYLCFVRSKWGNYDMCRYNTEYVGIYNSLSTKFMEITPNCFLSVYGRETLPFYYSEGGYVVIVKYMEAFGSETMIEESEIQLKISEAEFEKVMKCLRVSSFELTGEYLEEKNENGGLYNFEGLVGTRVYEGIALPEDLICGITDEECLKLLMTVVENQTKEEMARLLQN